MSLPNATIPLAMQAIGFMIASMACFSVMNICIRYVSFDMHTTQIVFLRNLFSIFILFPWVARCGISAVKTQRVGRHFLRGTIGVCGMQLWFYCVATLPLNDATALSFTAPIFTTIFAVLFLREPAGWHRWLAIFVGLVGALVIIRPNPDNMQWDAMVVLAATSMWAIANMLVKTLTTTEPANRIVFYMSIFMAVWSLPAAVWFWHTPTCEQLVLIVGVAIASTGAHVCLVSAYARADVVVLMPFDFFRLVFTAALAYLAFGEVADEWTWGGGAIIVGSAAYIARRETQKKRRILA